MAWSLNLHHPYNPANPIDSLAVAARAINNIIGGATLTAANGKPVVQSGLLSIAANCARYTGSGAVTSRHGFPDRCAKPITSPAGLGYLVADVFQKWVVGHRPAPPRTPPCCSRTRRTRDPRSAHPPVPAVLEVARLAAPRPPAPPALVTPAWRCPIVPPASRPQWQQATALITIGAGSIATGFSLVPKAPADLTTPASIPPVTLLALEHANAARAWQGRMLRAAIVHMARHFLRLARPAARRRWRR